jgi:membrane associated rhomboid family serine protease
VTSGRDLFAPKLGLTLPLCGLHFIFFFLVQADAEKTIGLFSFQPATALAMPWTFLSYQFLTGSAFSLFFGTMMLYIVGSALEAEWGTGPYTVFWLVATLGGSLSAFFLGVPMGGGTAVWTSMLFSFAYLAPETTWLIFFVLPVKVKWLAWLAAGYLVVQLVRLALMGRPGAGVVLVLGSCTGFAWIWIRHQGAWKARHAAVDAAAAIKGAGAVRDNILLERRNRDLFPRVEELRRVSRQGGDLPPRTRDFASDLAKLVVPGVKICKPIDFKGDKDGICVRCEGFAECSLRYVAGQPEEIVIRNKDS